MVIKKISNCELVKLIEQIIIEQQDTARMKGLLAAEIKLALEQRYDIKVNTQRISRLIKDNIAGVTTRHLPTSGLPLNIYRIMR